LLSLLVTGCITSAEQVAQRNNERCLERGYQPMTDAFSDCLVRLESERDRRIEARRREMMEAPPSPPISRGY
jgi:hypothetical protein